MEGIAKNLNQALIEDKVELIRNIAVDYNLDADELIEKYVNSDATSIGSSHIRRLPAKKKRQDYVETEECTFEGIKYLVDSKNQVYTYNLEKPMMIGERLVDGSIKFFEAYLTTLS